MRTVIEIEGKDAWEFEANAVAVMKALGYERTRTAETGAFHADLISALCEEGRQPWQIVEEYRAKRVVMAAPSNG